MRTLVECLRRATINVPLNEADVKAAIRKNKYYSDQWEVAAEGADADVFFNVLAIGDINNPQIFDYLSNTYGSDPASVIGMYGLVAYILDNELFVRLTDTDDEDFPTPESDNFLNNLIGSDSIAGYVAPESKKAFNKHKRFDWYITAASDRDADRYAFSNDPKILPNLCDVYVASVGRIVDDR